MGRSRSLDSLEARPVFYHRTLRSRRALEPPSPRGKETAGLPTPARGPRPPHSSRSPNGDASQKANAPQRALLPSVPQSCRSKRRLHVQPAPRLLRPEPAPRSYSKAESLPLQNSAVKATPEEVP